MSDFKTPDSRQARILRENQMDPEEYGVILSGETFLVLLCYATRCTIRIDQGDKKWA